MDRPSTIMLCRVMPGIGFKVILVFSAELRIPLQVIYLLQTTEAEKISSLGEEIAQIDITPTYQIVFMQNRDRTLIRRPKQPLSSLKPMLARDCWGNSGVLGG